MMSKFKFGNYRYTVVLAVQLAMLVMGCAAPQLSKEGWNIVADSEKEIITVNYEDLGCVVKDARIGLRENGKLSYL